MYVRIASGGSPVNSYLPKQKRHWAAKGRQVDRSADWVVRTKWPLDCHSAADEWKKLQIMLSLGPTACGNKPLLCDIQQKLMCKTAIQEDIFYRCCCDFFTIRH